MNEDTVLLFFTLNCGNVKKFKDILFKGLFLYIMVFCPSEVLYTSPPGRSVHSNTNSENPEPCVL